MMKESKIDNNKYINISRVPFIFAAIDLKIASQIINLASIAWEQPLHHKQIHEFLINTCYLGFTVPHIFLLSRPILLPLVL